MVESRWLRSIGPGVIALGAVGLFVSTTLGGGDRPFAPRACAGPPSSLVAAAAQPAPDEITDLRRSPWFRVDPSLDRDGALRAQRLVAGPAGDHDPDASELPSESFVSGPFGRILLVGSDDGTSSRLVAFDVTAGCAWTIAQDRDVIRRATMDRTGTNVYETRVDRVSRTDLGVWLRPVGLAVRARRILAPLEADDRFGRTFSTEFTWDAGGGRLAVQSCGEVACRTRVIAPSDDPPMTLDDPDLGILVGFSGDRVVTYGACRGFPCPIVSTDLATGERRVLEPDGGPAVVIATPVGSRLVHEVRSGAERFLRAAALDGGQVSALGPIPNGLALHAAATDAAAGVRLPSGWVLLSPDGRLPVERTPATPLLRRIPDGTTVTLEEAAR